MWLCTSPVKWSVKCCKHHCTTSCCLQQVMLWGQGDGREEQLLQGAFWALSISCASRKSGASLWPTKHEAWLSEKASLRQRHGKPFPELSTIFIPSCLHSSIAYLFNFVHHASFWGARECHSEAASDGLCSQGSGLIVNTTISQMVIVNKVKCKRRGHLQEHRSSVLLDSGN